MQIRRHTGISPAWNIRRPLAQKKEAQGAASDRWRVHENSNLAP